MKKSFLTILITLCGMPAFAFEDCMIISQSPVKSVTVQNPEILDAQPLFTIDNEKKFIIITPKSAGKTRITVDLYDSEKTLPVKVTNTSTTVTLQEGFETYTVDTPPLGIEIPAPPAEFGGGNG